MTSYLAKIATKKIFKETAGNKGGQEDPYFETVPATRLGFKTKKKQRRALPPGLTAQEEKVLTKAKRRAYRIDLALGSFLGMKIGWGAVIGLIPGFGDVADMLLALMVFRTCCSVEPGLPASVKMKMQMNICIDFVIGIIPFIGDIADAAYKCNTRNVVLLEDVLRQRGAARIKGRPEANMADPSLPDEWDYQNEETLVQQNGPPPRYQSQRQSRRDGRNQDLEAGNTVPPPMPARPR